MLFWPGQEIEKEAPTGSGFAISPVSTSKCATKARLVAPPALFGHMHWDSSVLFALSLFLNRRFQPSGDSMFIPKVFKQLWQIVRSHPYPSAAT